MLRPTLLVLLAVPSLAACAPEYTPATQESSAEAASTGDTQTTASEDATTSSTTEASSDDDSGAECEGPEACPDQRPYCDAGRCVDCTEIGHAGCLARDAERPICDPEDGLCVQCTQTLSHNCVGTTPVCEAGSCRGCEEASECEAYCNESTGACDVNTLSVSVFEWEYADEPGFAADRVEYVTSRDSSWASADVDGHVEFVDVPYDEAFRVGARNYQSEPTPVSSALNWVWWPRAFPTGEASQLRLPYLNKATLGRFAYECGLFEDLTTATGQVGGLPAEFQDRATYLVQLDAPDASPAPVDRDQIELELDDALLHHGDDTELMPVFVCDVEQLGALRIGNGANEFVGTHGWFLVFGAHDEFETPFGDATVSVPGYEPAAFLASTTAAVYYLRLSPD